MEISRIVSTSKQYSNSIREMEAVVSLSATGKVRRLIVRPQRNLKTLSFIGIH